MARTALLLASALGCALSATAAARPVDPTPPVAVPAPPRSDAPGVLSVASGDTTWFGGTTWDPVDARWEALPDSVWTFETGVASAINADPAKKPVGLHSLLEGWVGVNLGYDHLGLLAGPVGEEFRRRSESEFVAAPVCVGDATGVLGGDWSLWAGLTEAEAESACYVAGQGYGDNWEAVSGRTFAYAGGAVQLSFEYVVDSEPGFDYAYVEVDTTGIGDIATVWAKTGSISGTANIVLTPGASLPSSPGDVTVRFRFFSDGIYADDDGMYDTVCGGVAVDDIVLTGGINYACDFETDTGGWHDVPSPFSTATDWSDVQAVADLPPLAGSETCALGDSAMTFVEGRPPNDYHGCLFENLAVSPWIDLAEHGVVGQGGFVVDLQGFFYLPWPYYQLECRVQWTAPTCSYAGEQILEEFVAPFYYFPEPQCRYQIDLTGSIPADAEKVRLVVGGYSSAWFILCDPGPSPQNTAPWIDAVRFGVYNPAATAIPDPRATTSTTLGAFRPNPMTAGGGGSVAFAVAGDTRVHLDVFDIAGRRVRTLWDRDTAAGDYRAAWDGRDESGAAASGGVYFIRLATPTDRRAAKVVLIPR